LDAALYEDYGGFAAASGSKEFHHQDGEEKSLKDPRKPAGISGNANHTFWTKNQGGRSMSALGYESLPEMFVVVVIVLVVIVSFVVAPLFLRPGIVLCRTSF